MSDPTSPSYYQRGGIELMDVIEAWGLGWLLGNALKYIMRAGHKDDAVQDLRKARRYIDRQIAQLETETSAKLCSYCGKHPIKNSTGLCEQCTNGIECPPGDCQSNTICGDCLRAFHGSWKGDDRKRLEGDGYTTEHVTRSKEAK